VLSIADGGSWWKAKSPSFSLKLHGPTICYKLGMAVAKKSAMALLWWTFDNTNID